MDLNRLRDYRAFPRFTPDQLRAEAERLVHDNEHFSNTPLMLLQAADDAERITAASSALVAPSTFHPAFLPKEPPQ
jgi:hypothetical protein